MTQAYLRARYYDSTTGRFISEDPARDGTNWYVYCFNDAVNLWDTDGLKPKPNYKTIEEAVAAAAIDITEKLKATDPENVGKPSSEKVLRYYEELAVWVYERTFNGETMYTLLYMVVQEA